MKPNKALFFVTALLTLAVLLPLVSCKSTPATPATSEEVVESANEIPAALDELGTALSRTESARSLAEAVNGQGYFPEDWDKAEADYNAGKDAIAAVDNEGALAALALAGGEYETITGNSIPMYKKDVETARTDMEAGITRAGESRQKARDNNGQGYFPDDWQAAENALKDSVNKTQDILILDEIKDVATLYASVADQYDAITEKSGPLAAKDKEDAQKALNDAIARADQSRKDAQAAQAPTHAADGWKQAETDLQTAKSAKKTTLGEIKAAQTQYTAVADSYDSLAAQSRPLAEKGEAQKTLDAAIARTEKSRQAAEAVNGQTYFPEDWESAETANTSAKSAKTDTTDDIKAAAGLYGQAADAYDALTKKSGEQLAKEKEAAQKTMNDAAAKAEQARKDAQAAQAATHMADEWKKAEADLQAAKSAKKTTPEEIKAAEAQYTAAAAAYADLAEKSRPLAVLAEAKKTLDAAIARAEKSRQAATAADAQTYFPTDWKGAEDKNTAAKGAKVETEDEIKAAAGLYGQAADAYDAVARKSGEQLAKEKEEAQRVLNAAITKADQSRKAASDAKGQTYFPDDWKSAEDKNAAARNAKKTTPAEIKAALPLYTQASQAYDALAQKSGVRAAEETQKLAQDSKVTADTERQKAVDAKAQVAVKDVFDKAEVIYQQAVKDLAAKSFTQASGGFNQSAPMFNAAAIAADSKRGRAEDLITQAKQKAADSVTFAENSGRAMEEQTEGQNE